MASVSKQDNRRDQERNKMVISKGTFNTGKIPKDINTRRSVGVSSFKVYSEDEKIKVDDNTSRKAIPAKKGASVASTSDSKKGILNNMGTDKVKRVVSAKAYVQRKALADVSNVLGNSSRTSVPDGSKFMVSVGRGAKTLTVTSRKSFMGGGREHIRQVVGDNDDSNRGMKDIQHFSDQRKPDAQNSVRESVTTDNRRSARISLTQTRKSLPASKRANQVDTTNGKEIAGGSEKAKELSGFAVKTKVATKFASQVAITERHLWRNRASDGFITMADSSNYDDMFITSASRGQSNVDACTLSRRSVKPTVKTSAKAYSGHGILKSKCSSGLPKSKEKVGKSSLSGNLEQQVSREAAKTKPSSDGDDNPSTNIADIIARRNSDRRRSYTSLLMAGPKLLKEHGEVLTPEKLPIIDDGCNHLEVAEYVDEIYRYYWVMEAQSPPLENYLSIQTDITCYMRGILINWLIEVHFKFDLMQETLYLMVTLLDQYLSQVKINKKDMQLVGLTALLLASKYEDFWHPRIKDLISISVQSYSREEMLEMEKLMLNKLKFRLNAPTPYVFMLRFLKAAQSDSKLEHLAFYLIELSLVEYEALKFKPSLLCASAIYVARCTLKAAPSWTPLLVKHTRYDVPQMRDCSEMILKFHKAAKSGQLNVTYGKFRSPNLSGVAGIEPLDWLPF